LNDNRNDTTPGSVTTFGLIRHARTFWNLEKRIQGQQDSPLTDAGLRLADAWAKRLETRRWDCLLTSDLGRAEQTAKIINRRLNVPIESDPRLREQNWGQWTGKTLGDIKRQYRDVLDRQISLGWKFRPPEGEDRISVRRRGLRVLMDAAQKRPGQIHLVVSHEGLIKCLIYHLLNRGFLASEPAVLRPYHLHWLICSDGRIELSGLNAIALEVRA
jgi:broad specificity phosphatase PhoE